MKKERLLYLDLIKLVAVIMVFTIHFTRTLEYAQINFTTHVLPDTLFGMYLGSYGVTLFFIVSGAVLMYIYGDKEIDLASYYKKRFLGIYPMFWLAFAIFFIAKEISYIRALPKVSIMAHFFLHCLALTVRSEYIPAHIIFSANGFSPLLL